MRQIILLFCFSLIYVQAISQIDSLKWTDYFGEANFSAKNCMLAETVENNIAVFAPSNNGILFCAEIDSEGNQLSKGSFEFPKSKIKAVLTINEGYLLVGSQKKGFKSRPRVWQINKDFSNLETYPNNLGVGSFNALTQTKNPNEVMITGKIANQMCIYTYRLATKNLELFFLNKNIPSEGKSIIYDNMKELVVAGFQKDKKIPKLTVWKVDANSNIVKGKPFQYNISNTSAEHLIQLDDSYLLVTGLKYKDATTSNIFLKLPPNLNTDNRNKPFSLPSINASERIFGLKTIQTQQHLLTVGKHRAFGAQTDDIWLSWFSKDNLDTTNIPQDSIYLESGFSDSATDILKLKNNDYLMASISGKRKKINIKLFYFKSQENTCLKTIAKVGGDKGVFFDARDEKTPLPINGLYPFEGHLLSNTPIQKRDIHLFNETVASKLIIPLELKPDSTLDGQYCYQLKTRLNLQPEVSNRIHLEIKKEGHKMYEQIIPKNFQLEKPNLHLITIGINLRLNYCREDAKAIDTLFRTQEGKLFKRVYSYSLTEESQTDGNSIIDFLSKFCNNLDANQKVTPKDVIILFLSSHGENKVTKNGEERFILPAMDYDSTNSTTYIDYNDNIIQNLNRLPGKKVIFIDACKSGSIKSTTAALNSGIVRILEAPSGFITVSSSEEDKLSYECGAKYKNGAFTYTIKKALKNKEVRQLIDFNEDEVISMGELFNYLNIEVPITVKACAGDNSKQNPQFIFKDNDKDLKDLPIFYIH